MYMRDSRDRALSCLVGTLMAVTLATSARPADAKPGPPPCADAAYVVAEAPLIPGDTTLAHNALVVAGRTLAAGGSCTATKARVKRTKGGTRLAARWKRCTGIEGPVAFKGGIDGSCTRLTGRLRGRKARLTRTVEATVSPAGTLSGLLRLIPAIAVPESARAELLAQRAAIAALGGTVADDGSVIRRPATGAGGWLVTLGERRAYARADGTFTIARDPLGPTEGLVFHPSDETVPVGAFWVVPHLVAAGATPTPIDVEVRTQGACGMDENPADEPAHCAALAPPPAATPRPRTRTPTPQITFTWTTGPLGTYPSYARTSCVDQDGGIGLSGETILGAITNYYGSTCETQVTLGCCENELGTIYMSIKTTLGKLTGFKPVGCEKNHKGRLCNDLLRGDVGVQVPAGIVNARSTLGLPNAIEQPVGPQQVVPVTVHHNACYGETVVTKTVDELNGTLGTLSNGKVLHYAQAATGRFTFTPDVALAYASPACQPGESLDGRDVYEFAADGFVATVTFRMICSPSTTSTTTVTSVTTSTIAGRAVTLLLPTGSFGAGTALCLSRITGGCVTPAHAPFCTYEHLHAAGTTIAIDGAGAYVDPHLSVGEQCGYGGIVTVAGCGPDGVPPCS